MLKNLATCRALGFICLFCFLGYAGNSISDALLGDCTREGKPDRGCSRIARQAPLRTTSRSLWGRRCRGPGACLIPVNRSGCPAGCCQCSQLGPTTVAGTYSQFLLHICHAEQNAFAVQQPKQRINCFMHSGHHIVCAICAHISKALFLGPCMAPNPPV